jgi:hypothetical protein
MSWLQQFHPGPCTHTILLRPLALPADAPFQCSPLQFPNPCGKLQQNWLAVTADGLPGMNMDSRLLEEIQECGRCPNKCGIVKAILIITI